MNRIKTTLPATLARLWNAYLVNQTALLTSMLIIGVIGIWGLLANSAHQENLEFRALLQKQVAAGIADQARAVGNVILDYAAWDEFNDKANRPQPDMAWVHDNLAPSIYSNLDIDVALLIDPEANKILYGTKNGKRIEHPATALPLTSREWQWIDEAMRHPQAKSPVIALADTTTENGRTTQTLYLVAIHPIVKYDSSLPAQHAKLLLFARKVDEGLLRSLSYSYLIHDPQVRFTQENLPDRMTQAINGINGTPIAYLTWAIDPPGDTVMALLAPGALVLCILLLILGYLLGHQARRLQTDREETVSRLRRQGQALRTLVENGNGQGNTLLDLKNLCRQIAVTLNADRAGIWRYDPDNGTMSRIAGADNQVDADSENTELPADPDYLWHLDTFRFLVMPNLDDTSHTPAFIDYARRSGIRSLLDATVRAGSRMHGILGVECRRERIWTQDEINFVCSAADAMALLTESNARQTAEGELSHLFYYDRNTGLPNSHKLRLHIDTITSVRHPRAGACILLDVGNLSNIIEAYGQQIGDLLIAGLAARFDAETRPGEMAARMSESRFALWLEGTTEAELTTRLNHMQQALLKPLQLEGESIYPRFQIGASLFPGDGHNASTLLEQAGSAMQYARKLSKQSWVRFNSGLSSERRQHHRLQMGLRDALGLSQMHLVFQPFIELSTGKVVGAEALLRWTHPDQGDIPPGVFIPLAEEDDALINALGAWVLDQACTRIARWRHEHGSTLFIAVNVSVRQMETVGFHHVVAHTLQRHGLPPQALELEVTESVALSGTPELEVNLKALQRLGVPLAIDDFGTGYASFSYLRRFPAVRLKVDRQFFDQVPANPQSSNLVKMIVAMGHAMGAQVIGEGVESAEQVAFLKHIGGDYAQGFYFSRPLSPSGMETFLKCGPYQVPDLTERF
jgi:diguanylate cyclase (GGDEF)-like protein